VRIGIGYDLHRLVPSTERNSTIHLGGVAIASRYQVRAHSDGDVLLHALVDACLGAAALGDIGQMFPDTDQANANRSSRDFVAACVSELARVDLRVQQVDSTVITEEPKIAPHAYAIRESIATMLGLELTEVSVKAKTNEGLGAIGERQAIAAQTIVLLAPK
jgi:2-C-methyl-D-erythritol 2,4-cyclodiphosphate synthase